MAMSLDTAIKFTAKLEGQGLDQLKRGLQGMAQQANRSSKDLDQLYNANKKLSQAAGQSINSLNRQVQVLTNLRNEAQLGSRQFKFYSAELEKLQRQQARLDSAGGAQGGFLGALGGIRGGLAGVAALVGTAGLSQVVGGIATASMEAENATVRLKALTSTYGEYNQAQQIAAKIASTLRITNTEATDSFSKLYAGLRPTGVGLKELEQIFVGFNVAARVSGATAEETRNAMIQLKQSLVSGVAQGDELRSILEQAPALGQAVADQLSKLGTFGKVTRSQLKELGSEGKITTDVLIEALKQLGDTELPKLEASFNTGSQAVTDLQNAVNKLQVALGNAFGPIALDLIRGFTKLVNGAADAMERFNRSRMDRGQQIATNEQAFRNAAKKIYGDENMGGLISFLNSDFRAQYEAERQRLIAGAQKGPALPEGSGDTREAREAAAAEREATRAAARKKALEDEVKIRKDAEDKLADAAQRNAEQLADFQQETIKRAAALERDLGDERLKIERQIADTRTKLQAVLEDRALEAERQRLAAAGLSTEGIDTAREVKEIFRRYDEQRIENDRNAVDAQTDLQRRLEEYKLSVAEGIGKIQESYARTVSNILQDAGEKLAEKMRQGAQDAADTLGGAAGGASGALGPNRLMPGTIGRGQLNVSQLKALALAAGFADRGASIMAAIAMAESGGRSAEHNNNPRTGDNSYGLWQVNMLGGMGPERRRAFGIGSNEALFDPAVNASAARKVFESQGFGAWSVFKSGAYRQFLPAAMRAQAGAPPAPMLPAAPAAGLPAGVQQAGAKLDAALSESKRQQQLLNEQQTLAALEQKYGAITDALSSQQEVAANKLRDEVRYFELIKQGVNPEIAKQRVELEATAAIEQTKLLAMEEELQKKIATLPVESSLRQELEKQVKAIEDRLNLQGLLVDKTLELADAERKAREEREKTEQRAAELKELYGNIKSTIADGIIGGIEATIEAAMTGAEDLEDQLKQIAAGVLKQIGSALLRFGLNSLFPGFGFANGGIMTSSGPAPLKRYSQGGIANRPQLALYGEGSKPEAYVPLPDGRRIPVALQGQDKMREVMGAGPTQGAASPVLNMSFQTTNIGGVEYVSREQLEAAMAETRRAASRDGAKRGMTMTLDKLQQSPSTRTRVGLR